MILALNTLMPALLAAVVVNTSNPKRLIMLFVGLLICLTIVLFIMRKLAADPIAYTILWVVLGVIGLLLTMDYFF